MKIGLGLISSHTLESIPPVAEVVFIEDRTRTIHTFTITGKTVHVAEVVFIEDRTRTQIRCRI